VFPKDLISCMLVRSLNDYDAVRVKALASMKRQQNSLKSDFYCVLRLNSYSLLSETEYVLSSPCHKSFKN